MDDLEDKLKTNKKALDLLQEQANLQQANKVDTLELQRLVPIDPFVDQLLLDLKGQELSTKSVMSNLGISYSKTALSELLPVIETQNAETGAATPAAVPVAAQGTEPGAPEVSKVVLGMTVKSPTYSDFKNFILGIEGLERIVKIDSLTMTDEDTYNISISIYYAPDFNSIKERLPKANFPAPSGKTIPIKENKAVIENRVPSENKVIDENKVLNDKTGT